MTPVTAVGGDEAANRITMTATPAAPGPPSGPTRPALWLRSLIAIVAIVVLLFVIEAIDAATHFRLNSAGIEPREIDGLDGILWAPLLHANVTHLVANLIPGAVLGYLLFLARRFLVVTAIVWVVSGLGVWLFAPAYTVTVGASGVIFGWLTYLLVRGLFNRNIWQILGGFVLFLVYGSVLWGVLPTRTEVSWQGHLFGAAGGVLAAWWLSGRDRRRHATPPPKSEVTS